MTRWMGRSRLALSAIHNFSGVTSSPFCRTESISSTSWNGSSYHAGADNRAHRGACDARRQATEFYRLPIDDQSVSGIVAALEAHDIVDIGAECVDNFSFSFVAPL